SISHFFSRYKKLAIMESSLEKGDTVIVFCCRTGLDFPPILKKIGKEGRIIGIDFSSVMLKKAREKIRKNNWQNIELIEDDVTQLKNANNFKADAGVCTLGKTIIPNFKLAIHNLLSSVKYQGEIIIGDIQLASGWQGRLNPFTLFLSKRYGGTFEGHQNSLILNDMLTKELSDIRKKEFFFKSYYYCIGKKSNHVYR
ncbi:methyltransferase domain-containing protein, partial [Bacteroidota bacterium]